MDATRAKVLSMFDAGCTTRQIRQKTHISEEKLRRLLQRTARSFKQRNNATIRPISDKQRRQIVRLFDARCTQLQIMQQVGVHANGVKRVLKHAGKSLTLRNRDAVWQSRATPAQRERICQMFDEGCSRLKIGKSVGMTKHQVERELALAGKILYRFPHVLEKALRGKQVLNATDISRPENERSQNAGNKGDSVSRRVLLRKSSCLTDKPEETLMAPTNAAESYDDGNEPSTPAYSVTSFAGAKLHVQTQASKVRLAEGTVRDALKGTLNIKPEQAMEECRRDGAPVAGKGQRYACSTCQLSWHHEDDLRSHLLGAVHRKLAASGGFFVCTGCSFKSRKPLKMTNHIIVYQARSRQESEGIVHTAAVAPPEA